MTARTNNDRPGRSGTGIDTGEEVEAATLVVPAVEQAVQKELRAARCDRRSGRPGQAPTALHRKKGSSTVVVTPHFAIEVNSWLTPTILLRRGVRAAAPGPNRDDDPFRHRMCRIRHSRGGAAARPNALGNLPYFMKPTTPVRIPRLTTQPCPRRLNLRPMPSGRDSPGPLGKLLIKADRCSQPGNGARQRPSRHQARVMKANSAARARRPVNIGVSDTPRVT
jgi:hypothetical protein